MLKLEQVHERFVTLVKGFKEGLVGWTIAEGSPSKEVDVHPWATFVRNEQEVFSAMVNVGGEGRDQTLSLVNMGITVCEPTIVCFAVEAYTIRTGKKFGQGRPSAHRR